MALTMPPTVDSYRISAKYYDGAYGAMKDLVDSASIANWPASSKGSFDKIQQSFTIRLHFSGVWGRPAHR